MSGGKPARRQQPGRAGWGLRQTGGQEWSLSRGSNACNFLNYFPIPLLSREYALVTGV